MLVVGIFVVGDIEFFVWYVDIFVIVIIGLNGKSIVIDLSGVLVNVVGVKVVVGGNIGVLVLDLIFLDVELYVFELLSF